MARKLVNMDITHISLVRAGANKKDIIYKSKNKNPTIEHQFNISKTSLEKGIVYGIVYAPNEVDTDGDFTTVEEIEKAAYSFMKNLRLKNVDMNHTFVNEDAYVCESWIIRNNDELFSNEPIGSWAVGIKLESESLKDSVKNGEIQGISMAGLAGQTEDIKVESMKSLKEVVSNLFTKTEQKGDNKMSEELKNYLEELNNTVAEGFDKLGKEIENLKKKNDNLEKENKEFSAYIKKSRQDNMPGSKDSNSGEGII